MKNENENKILKDSLELEREKHTVELTEQAKMLADLQTEQAKMLADLQTEQQAKVLECQKQSKNHDKMMKENEKIITEMKEKFKIFDKDKEEAIKNLKAANNDLALNKKELEKAKADADTFRKRHEKTKES